MENNLELIKSYLMENTYKFEILSYEHINSYISIFRVSEESPLGTKSDPYYLQVIEGKIYNSKNEPVEYEETIEY